MIYILDNKFHSKTKTDLLERMNWKWYDTEHLCFEVIFVRRDQYSAMSQLA